MVAAEEKSPSEVFEPLVEEGEEELTRSLPDLSLSGLIAGLDISLGALAAAVVAGRLMVAFHLDLKQAIFLGSFLYPLGFVFVVLGKSELFTENTLTPVAGLLAGRGTLSQLARSWTVILLSNVAGSILFSLLVSRVAVVFDPYRAVYREMGMQFVAHSFVQAALAGLLAGWLVALIGWLIESVRGNVAHFLIIYSIAYLLVALSLYHCIIGSTEVLLASFAGAPISWLDWLGKFLLPAVLGNAIGGVIFVTGLKGFQARSKDRGPKAPASRGEPA